MVNNLPNPTFDNPYILQIERTSSNSAVFSVFDKDMGLISSYNETAFDRPGVPDDLYIPLMAREGTIGGSTIVYDDLQIIVPEPTTLALLALGSLALRLKKSR